MSEKEVAEYLIGNSRVLITPMNHEQNRARITMDFGIFKIKGFVVKNVNNKTWVNPPSYPAPKTKQKFGKTFWSDYPGFWEALSKKMLQAYDEDLIKRNMPD